MSVDSTGFAHINIDYILDLADGEEEVLLQMLGVFISSISSSISSLTAAVDTDNLADCSFYAHKLKGSLNFIGSVQAAELLALTEQYCNAHTNKGDIRTMVAKVKGMTEDILKELHHLLGTLAAT